MTKTRSKYKESEKERERETIGEVIHIKKVITRAKITAKVVVQGKESIQQRKRSGRSASSWKIVGQMSFEKKMKIVVDDAKEVKPSQSKGKQIVTMAAMKVKRKKKMTPK